MSTARAALALAVLLSACGTDPSPGDDVGPDAVSGPPVTRDVVCQPFVREARTAGVIRERITYRYGLVDDVGPEAVFAVELCGRTTTPADTTPCPAGTTCTGSFTLPGQQCERTYRTGAFFDGKLRVACGYLFEQFDERGVSTGRQGTSFATVRVTTY